MSRAVRPAVLVVGVLALAAACGGDGGTSALESAAVTSQDTCAHVIGAEIERTGETFRVSAAVRSHDTGWDKYADAWEVLDESGNVLGTRELLHPHETEQPFTRSLSNVEIPSEVQTVTVRARDSVEGFCGTSLDVALQAPDREISE